MDWKIGLPLLVTAVLTMSGWFVGHWVSTRKDRSNKKRDLRTNYLIDCFRRIEYAGNRVLDEAGRKQLEAEESRWEAVTSAVNRVLRTV